MTSCPAKVYRTAFQEGENQGTNRLPALIGALKPSDGGDCLVRPRKPIAPRRLPRHRTRRDVADADDAIRL